jgi:hypothetical protein
MALLVHLGLHGRYGAPLGSYSADELAAMSTLNVLSAATLTVFVGLLLSGIIPAPERPAAPPESPPSPKRP